MIKPIELHRTLVCVIRRKQEDKFSFVAANRHSSQGLMTKHYSVKVKEGSDQENAKDLLDG